MQDIFAKNEASDNDIKAACRVGIFLSFPFCLIYIPLSLLPGGVSRLSTAMNSAYGVEALLVIIALIVSCLAISLANKFVKMTGLEEITRASYMALCQTIATVSAFTLSVASILALAHLGFEWSSVDIEKITLSMFLISMLCMILVIFSVVLARIYDGMKSANDGVGLRIFFILVFIAAAIGIAHFTSK
ncbi:hypothetical protein [Paracoccus sp. SM22M-07]|uniref:hypothetical protein n=1 Tax=Paracoccus sp. SM22M-07 TaxID=1520813 RepID=UPI0011149298|nr:hypothetical protein [Paracoccus sp. SM22M-07]